MTKDEALSLAITVGAHIERNSCNSEILTSFTEHELLAFANAIADAQREKDAKICDAMHGERNGDCADAIRANSESPESDIDERTRLA